MKFVFFGYDLYVSALERLLKDGHELLGLYTSEYDNIHSFNKKTLAFAKKLNVPVSLKKATEEDIQSFIDKGCEVFLSCGYPHKIPHIDHKKSYGINLHPSLLPKCRGSMPIPYIILDDPSAAGVTVHKLSSQFDAGDILYQHAIEVTDKDTVDSCAQKIASQAPMIVSKVMGNIVNYWDEAVAQDEEQATYFSEPDQHMRTVKWDEPCDRIDRRLRAFGSFGTFAYLNGKLYVIFRHKVLKEDHAYPHGMITEATANKIKVAVPDGFIIITKFTAP